MRRPLAAGRVTSTDPALFVSTFGSFVDLRTGTSDDHESPIRMKNAHIFIAVGATAMCLSFFSLTSCGRDTVNSIGDSHFADNGAPLDSTHYYFTPTCPSSVKLYIETSGSMNGFFRANQSTKFKSTVWSVFSGLKDLTDGNVYTLSNGGTINAPVSIMQFQSMMNGGKFVSNSSTKIPDMLESIIADIDVQAGTVAVLVSDMKYSPMGAAQAPLLDQYQADIRNIMGRSNISVSFVCAGSEYLDKKGGVAVGQSPYYFIILGNSEQVADIRNDIASWTEYDAAYIESGDMCMQYQTPPYAIHSVQNGITHYAYPNHVITNFDRNLSDTCSFILRISMNGYPWSAMNPDVLEQSLSVKAVYGASTEVQLLNTPEHIMDEHHYKSQLERQAYVDYQVKVYNLNLDDEVLAWTFSNKPFDGRYSADFATMASCANQDDLTGSYSFDRFIKGCYNGQLNRCDESPLYILISSDQN
jgi:hypothetical protein